MAQSLAFWEAGRGIAMIRSVAIGRSVVTVGVPGGTLITAGTRLSADSDAADPAELKAALAEPEERRTIGELTEQSVMTASEATDRVEQAADLLGDALAGKLVDLDRAGQVLDVLQRLDKDGRHEEWLRYARSVHGVLVLLKRWAELLRLLRTLLRSGDQVHAAGRAWAQHELGTLCVAAGDKAQAARLLERARRTRERLGDADGVAATEQSLGVLCRQAKGGVRPGRVALVAAALLLLAVGGVAGAVITQPGREPLSVAVVGAGLVTAASAAVSCPDRCDAELERGTHVTLTASARRGSTFAGWDGDCSGTESCRLTMDGARTATARFERTPQARVVTVRRDGDGAGRVTSAAGIDCGGACRTSVEAGTRVRLDAEPEDGSSFAGWSGGGCEGTGPCELTVREAVTITALFTADTIPPGELVLNIKRSGSGRVSSRPAGIDCGDECDAPFSEGTTVALFQQADPGWEFAGWSGAGCSGTGECRVQMTQAQVVAARFVPAQPTRFTLTTATSGAGELIPPCAQGCAYDAGTVVPLTATPAGENNSVAFTGCTPAVPGDFSCEVTMSENRTVSARFFFAEP
jgi:hypothetical protein